MGILLLIAMVIQLSCAKKPTPPPTRTPRFDQERAYTLLKDICGLGPRNHGSEGKSQAEKWIQARLREAGADVSLDEFTYTPKQSGNPESFRNIVARIRPLERRRVLVATHYDTRSWADRDPHKELRSNPIIGADDGASGVAVMLEMARVWKDDPPPVGVDLIFFDGEDFGREGVLDDYFVGSKAWVREHPDFKPEWGVVIDMVGQNSLRLLKEKWSVERAPRVVQRIWDAAERVGSKAFEDEDLGHQIYDDHTALLIKGIPVALVIDLKYPYWHTTEDLPDKCSPDSLGQVGRAVMEAIYTP